MKIAIPEVPERGDFEVMLGCRFLNEANHGCQFAARDSRILQYGRRLYASQGAKSAASCRRKLCSLGRIFRPLDGCSSVNFREVLNLTDFIFYGRRMSVGFNQENRFYIRKANFRKVFDAAQGFAVKELERARNDFSCDDRRNGFGRAVHPVVGCEERLSGFQALEGVSEAPG